MKYLRLLLLPFSLLYGLVVLIRNWLFDAGWFKTTTFNIPVISVGNLAVGGAGKSPMAEYLIRLLKKDLRVATLSRGYGRATKGFVLANSDSTALDVGDEPSQFKAKFPDVTVAVCENRVTGIEKLKGGHEVVILDDAYQHRAVKSGFSILLFDYGKLDDFKLLLPAGNLREPFSGKMRADVLMVSKCPAGISENQRENICAFLKPYPYQSIYFTSIAYGAFKPLTAAADGKTINKNTTIYLLTGIAGTAPLCDYLEGVAATVIHSEYPDHHQFTLKNITKLANMFNGSNYANKVIVTTEKDAERLKHPAVAALLYNLPVLVLPIMVSFINGREQFDSQIRNYVRKYKKYSGIH